MIVFVWVDVVWDIFFDFDILLRILNLVRRGVFTFIVRRGGRRLEGWTVLWFFIYYFLFWKDVIFFILFSLWWVIIGVCLNFKLVFLVMRRGARGRWGLDGV